MASGITFFADPTIPYADNLQSYNRYSYVQNNPLSRTDPSGFADKEKKKKKKHKVQSDTSSKSPTEKPTAQNQSTKSGVTGRGITADGNTKDYRGGETGGVMAGTHGGFFGNLWSGTKSLSSAAYNRLNYESGLILNASGDLLSAPDRVLNWATGTDEYDRFNMAVNTSFIGDDMIVGGLAALTRSGRALNRLTHVVPNNSVPSRMARVVPNNPVTRNSGLLGPPSRSDVFVTAADDIRGLNANQIAERLTIQQSPTGFRVMEFNTPSSGVSSPINRLDGGFIGGGRTAGGAREFVIPNGPIPVGSTMRVIP